MSILRLLMQAAYHYRQANSYSYVDYSLQFKVLCFLYVAVVGGCHIQHQGSNAVAAAEYEDSPQSSYYSCVANSNCDYEVHVLGSYESAQGGNHPTGHPDVYLTVTGTSSRPLILVLSSYEPAAWTLHIPTGVEIDRVILVSVPMLQF